MTRNVRHLSTIWGERKGNRDSLVRNYGGKVRLKDKPMVNPRVYRLYIQLCMTARPADRCFSA